MQKIFKPAVFMACLIPFIVITYQIFFNKLGAEPVKEVTHHTGNWTLRFILISLAMTPLRNITNSLVWTRYRRMFGLFAFFYVACHFLTYIALDHFFDISFIIKDIIKRPFITFGFLSFVLLIPLALTSPKKMLKKLGYKVWKKIHYLIYPAALLSSFHFFMLVRANKIEPAIYIFIILALLLYRFYYKVIVPRLVQ